MHDNINTLIVKISLKFSYKVQYKTSCSAMPSSLYMQITLTNNVLFIPKAFELSSKYLAGFLSPQPQCLQKDGSPAVVA